MGLLWGSRCPAVGVGSIDRSYRFSPQASCDHSVNVNHHVNNLDIELLVRVTGITCGFVLLISGVGIGTRS